MRPDDPRVRALATIVASMFDGSEERRDALTMVFMGLADDTIETKIRALLVRGATASNTLDTEAMREVANEACSLAATLPGDEDVSWHSFMRELVKDAHANQRRILKRVKAAGSFGVSLDDVLGEFVGCTRQGVGGMLSGITKLCKRFGVDPERVIASRNDCYFPGEFLMKESAV
jgi:hypothetical protein